MKLLTRSLVGLALFVFPVPVQAQTQLAPEVRQTLENTVQVVTSVKQQLDTLRLEAEAILAAHPPVNTVASGGNAQAALDAGGIVALEAGGVYTGGLVIRTSGTILRGNNAHISATTTAALRVLPGVNDIYVENLSGTSNYQTVFQIGDNVTETQGSLELVPRRIVFSGLSVPTHRGKRGFEINGADVQLLNCSVADTWSSAGNDSQAVAILNTPGPVLIDGFSFSAGSEVILVGGDIIKLAGVIPSDITVKNGILYRPDSWRTDGVSRVVKSLFQLKTGNRVRVSDVTMDGSWTDGQGGPGISLTPRSGGAVTDVVFERITMLNVGIGVHTTGRDTGAGAPVTPTRTTGLVMRDSSVQATKYATKNATLSRGILALVLNGIDTIDFESVTFVGDGTQVVYVGDWEQVGRIKVVNSLFTTGVYSFMGPEGSNGTAWPDYVDLLDVQGNTISGLVSGTNTTGTAPSVLRNNFPLNTYVTRAELDALIAQQ